MQRSNFQSVSNFWFGLIIIATISHWHSLSCIHSRAGAWVDQSHIHAGFHLLVHVLCSLRNWCPCLEKAQVIRGGTVDEYLACPLETAEFWRVMVSPWFDWGSGSHHGWGEWLTSCTFEKRWWMCRNICVVQLCAFVNILQFFGKSHWVKLFSTDTFLDSYIATRNFQCGLPLMLLFLVILWSGRRDRWQENKSKCEQYIPVWLVIC